MYRKPQRNSPNLSGTDQERRAATVAVARVSAGQGHNAALARKKSDGGVRIRRRPRGRRFKYCQPDREEPALASGNAESEPVSSFERKWAVPHSFRVCLGIRGYQLIWTCATSLVVGAPGSAAA